MNDQPIPAATLILVREPGGNSPPELLMVERAEGMTFAGGALVFPGGRIDQHDRDLGEAFGPDGAARVAAIRETLEEVAIPVGMAPLPGRDTALELQRLLAGGERFGDLLKQHGLQLAPEQLAPLARWVPKFHAKRRFDTLFFLAAAPPGSDDPAPHPGECAGAEWVGAAEVLRRDSAGDVQLIFPTRRTLERLAQHRSLSAMLQDAARFPVEPITPHLEERDGETFVAIPENIGFPVTRERLAGLSRG
jgi:8-oxo-dGTP pyrophosphatase MutT (NUDIX family)